MTRASRLLLLLALFASVLAVAACGGGNEPRTAAETAAAPVPLEVALDWFPNPDHVALYYALERGFFADQNLAVTFETPSDVTAGLKLVATDRFDLSIYYEADLFFAAQEGLPVIAVGSLVPRPLNALISLADSKVRGPDTIDGATIGVAGLPFDDAILDTIRAQEGLAPDDVKSVNVGFDLVPALLSGSVDAVIGAYFNIEGIHLESQTGSPPTITRLEELGVPHYDELLVAANSERLERDPDYADAVRRFLAALVAATDAVQADEAGAIEIMKAETEYTAAELEAMVPDTLPLLSSPRGVPTGCFDLTGWETFGRWLLDNDLLEAAVDPATIATNEYLPGC